MTFPQCDSFFLKLFFAYKTTCQKIMFTSEENSRKQPWASAGEGKGAFAPPPPGRPRPAKNSMFLDFLGKNVIFFVVFKEKSRFLHPLEILPSPGKKSADAHVNN